MKPLLPLATAAALFVSQSMAVAQDPGFRPAEQPRARQQVQAPVAAAPAPAAVQERDDTASSVARITSMSQLNNTYRLNIGDSVVMRIVEDKGVPNRLQVQESGDIVVPYLNLVRAAGRTCRELAMEMKTELEKQYFQQATVIIALERRYTPPGSTGGSRGGPDWRPDDTGYITIYGQVIRQGKYEFLPEDQLTASQAILRAGGFAPFAKDKAVRVIRKTPKGNVTIVVNLRDVMTKGRLEKDIPILPNDVIIVEEKLINF